MRSPLETRHISGNSLWKDLDVHVGCVKSTWDYCPQVGPVTSACRLDCAILSDRALAFSSALQNTSAAVEIVERSVETLRKRRDDIRRAAGSNPLHSLPWASGDGKI
jgi:hypothetical protein